MVALREIEEGLIDAEFVEQEEQRLVQQAQIVAPVVEETPDFSLE